MTWKFSGSSFDRLEINGNFYALTQFGHKIQQVIMPIVTLKGKDFIPLGTGFIIGADGLINKV